MAKKASEKPTLLTDKEKRFCEEWIIDLNGAASARRTGYLKNSAFQAFRMLKKPKIQEYIKKLQEDRAIRTHITQDRVLQEYSIIAFSDIADYVNIDENTGVIIAKSFEEMGELKSRALKKIKEDRAIKESANGKKVTVYDKIMFETHDKMEALRFLAKHLGMEGGKEHINITSPEISKLMTQAHINHEKKKEAK